MFLARHPGGLLIVGWGSFIVLAGFSYFNWYCEYGPWFPRGGALLALTGYIVSVQEALLFRQHREPKYKEKTEIVVKESADDGPEFGLDTRLVPHMMGPLNPMGGVSAWDRDDPPEENFSMHEETEEEELETTEIKYLKEVDPGDEGRRIRNIEEMSNQEILRIQHAAIAGVIGTFVWAFGDIFFK